MFASMRSLWTSPFAIVGGDYHPYTLSVCRVLRLPLARPIRMWTSWAAALRVTCSVKSTIVFPGLELSVCQL